MPIVAEDSDTGPATGRICPQPTTAALSTDQGAA